MAKYRVLARSFINNTIVEEGAVIDFDGVPHANLEPMDKAAEAATAQATTADDESALRLRAAAAGMDSTMLPDGANAMV